jgi:hypothetical protein
MHLSVTVMPSAVIRLLQTLRLDACMDHYRGIKPATSTSFPIALLELAILDTAHRAVALLGLRLEIADLFEHAATP